MPTAAARPRLSLVVPLFNEEAVLPELERRLRGRGQDSEEAIQRRLRDARDEIAHVSEFDYVIINKEFEEARRDLAAVVRAARLKLTSQSARHSEIVRPAG